MFSFTCHTCQADVLSWKSKRIYFSVLFPTCYIMTLGMAADLSSNPNASIFDELFLHLAPFNALALPRLPC